LFQKKTLRQTSKVNLPTGAIIASKKMVKRNSCNDHLVQGLPSLIKEVSSNNENKGSAQMMGKKPPPVKRYNSGIPSSSIIGDYSSINSTNVILAS